MKTLSYPALLALLAVSAGLVACGGGGAVEASPQAANPVPASASESPEAYKAYAGSLIRTETGQPVDVNQVVPPTSESDLPLPLR